MENFISSGFGQFLLSLFSPHFSAPSLNSFLILSYGWSQGGLSHTIAEYLWQSGAVNYKHFSRYYLFLSTAFLIKLNDLWAKLILQGVAYLPIDMDVVIQVDDTTRKKSGRKIEGASKYRNGAGSARQEYRSIWGLNFVYAIWLFPLQKYNCSLPIPLGLWVYVKKAECKALGIKYRTRSALGRSLSDRFAYLLPFRRIRLCADGGYSTRYFLRDLPKNVYAVGRFPIKSRLLDQLKPTDDKRRTKGADLGTPKEWKGGKNDWKKLPDEAQTSYRIEQGYWHSVLPGVWIKVVVIWRKDAHKSKSSQKELEAFFSTCSTFSHQQILSYYRERWSIEIDIRNAYAYYGLGQDRCRNLNRINGINNFRLLLAAARTLFFIQQIQDQQLHPLTYLRPWYKKKKKFSQLDLLIAFEQHMQQAGVTPTPRFWVDTPQTQQPKQRLHWHITYQKAHTKVA